MKKLTLRCLLIAVALVLLLTDLVPREPALAWQGSGNLLQNPGFEGDFYAWSGMPEIQVAHGWTPWWRTREESDPPAYFFKPEYKKANGYIFPNRIHGGASAQQWFTFHATHLAGMYQQVFGVTPGVRYQFSIWAQVWSSSKDDGDRSENPAYPNLQVGIDPTGSWNPWASTVIWSGTYAPYDAWGQLSIEAVAQSDVITVFMRSNPNFPVKHNDMYWDDAALVVAGSISTPVPPPPTATPVPPGPTATSGGSSPPTATSAPPQPTPTCAPAPSDWVNYTVQRGDTLYSLAINTGTTVDRVKSVNCLGSSTIHVGQVLLLPQQPPTRTPTAAVGTVAPTKKPSTPTASPTPRPTRTPTVAPSETPTITPSVTPTAVEPTATELPPKPTTAPPTDTPAPVEVEDTATPTAPRATIPPPSTATPGVPEQRPTSTPAASSRPCGTIYVGAGFVLVAGVLRFRRRRRMVDT